MSSVISHHLKRFEIQILSLVPYAANDRLEYLIKKLLPEENPSHHLAVKNKIKSLHSSPQSLLIYASYLTIAKK